MPPSRLLELPAEIRDEIFRFALKSEKPLVSFRLDNYQRDTYQEAVQPALTRVSRQIRKESLPIFYETNDIILHSEGPKAVDTQQWFHCVEARLPSLTRVSLWMRYVTLTNDRSANGLICLPLRRPKGDDFWRVDRDWRWVTVTRRPAEVEGDAKFLISELNRMLSEEPHCLDSAERFVATMTDLKMLYVKDKMS